MRGVLRMVCGLPKVSDTASEYQLLQFFFKHDLQCCEGHKQKTTCVLCVGCGGSDLTD